MVVRPDDRWLPADRSPRRGYLWAVRAGQPRRIPNTPVPRAPDRRLVVAGLDRASRSPPVADRGLRHDPVQRPHGPARPADDRRPRRSWRWARPITLCSCASPAPRRRGAGSCRSSIRGITRLISFPVVTWILFAGVMWGPLLAALQLVAREPARPPARARAVPGRRPAVLVAGVGGRPEPVADAPPGRGLCTCSCRCRRTRSSRWRSCTARRRPLYPHYVNARPDVGPAPCSRTSRSPAGSCGSRATWCSSAIMCILRGLDEARGAAQTSVRTAARGASARPIREREVKLAARRAAESAAAGGPGGSGPGSGARA